MPATLRRGGWPELFTAAFRNSTNAMALVDERRRHVDVNGAYLNLVGFSRENLLGRPISELVADGPLAAPGAWAAALAAGHFEGEADLVCSDGSAVAVQWGAHAVLATERRLVLFVALSTSRWGGRFRRRLAPDEDRKRLSKRECQVVELVSLGRSGPEIAVELRIAHDTVRTHVRNAMAKVGARSRAHLVAKALADGVIPL
jgi:PAS domain S-box-containing protein